MKWLKLPLVVLVFCVSAGAAQSTAPAQGNVQFFATEQLAQQHCPGDQVVWVNAKVGVYNFWGGRWYAQIKRGAFVCGKDADKYGLPPPRNGP